MGFFKKLKFSSSGDSRKDGESWGVILKGVPDKKVEEALIHIFTERLDVPGDDALKIIRSSPIILFSNRTARDAEQIKLTLNKTGARTAISNDPADFRTLARVAWPKKIEAAELGGEDKTQAPTALPPPSSKPIKPIAPPAPKIPPPVSSTLPPRRHDPSIPPVSDEWKTKYENLNQVHRGLVEGLEKKDLELNQALEKIQELQTKLKILTEEREWAVRERDETKTSLSGLEHELLSLKDLQGTLEREKERLAQEKEQVEKTLEEIRKELLQSREIQESLQGEKSMLEREKARSLQEKESAVSARQQAEKALEEIRKELIRSREIRESLQKEINLLRLDRERPIPEIEKIKSALEAQIETSEKQTEPLKAQLKFFEKLLDLLKGSSKPLAPSPKPEASTPSPAPKPAQTPVTPITPLKRPASGGTGSTHIGIIPPSST